MIIALTIIALILSMFALRQLLPSRSNTSSQESEQIVRPAQDVQVLVKDHSNPERKEEESGPADESTDYDGIDSSNATPKVGPHTKSQVDVPSFALDTSDTSDEEEDNLLPPSFPAMNSAQRASSGPSLMLPPQAPRPSSLAPATTSNMPPPPRPISKSQPYTNVTTSLRIPSTGPLPNRSPVPNRSSATGNSLGLPLTGPIKAPNARQKVLLDPGHSPLDWANLVKSGENLAGVSSMMRITPSQLKYHNGRKGRPAWSVWQGKVYNITPYLPFHPGGKGELMRAAGKDGVKLFMDVHPWVNWENMLGECVVGILVGEGTAEMAPSALDDMD